MLVLTKADATTSLWRPLEAGNVSVPARRVRRVQIADSAGRLYLDAAPGRGGRLDFVARGSAGTHMVTARNAAGAVVATTTFVLQPATHLACDAGPYGGMANRLQDLLTLISGGRSCLISGRHYRLFVDWLRDHTHVLKAHKYHVADVKSGVEFFLERQQPNGMIWDDVHENGNVGQPSWLGEALGPEFNVYEDQQRWILRRIPVEADVEYLLVEAVWHAWKSTGDDAWLRTQLPRLHRAVAYMTSDPVRWSTAHGLVKRGYTMDTWDFTNPRYYARDHRHHPGPGEPYFLYHGDNSGCYAALQRLAEMHAALGEAAPAAAWRRRAQALRRRANAALWRAPAYAHMVPETPLTKAGDLALQRTDEQRLSLSLGYTLNRGLPTPAMARQVLREYQRRGAAQRATSFAEWWTMDPMYTREEWPDPNWSHTTLGEYMNGAITPLVAGELARAAFECGMEAYGVDILRRLQALAERDGGYLAEAYYRTGHDQGASIPPPPAQFTPLDLRAVANVGLRNGAQRGVVAWTGEGDNDMRNLPVGDQVLQHIGFHILDPQRNRGRAVLALGDEAGGAWTRSVTVPVGRSARSLYFLHTLGRAGRDVVATYDVRYADCTEERLFIKTGVELGNWWNAQPLTRVQGQGLGAGGAQHPPNHIGRLAWLGPNPSFGSMGVYVYGWNNPQPGKEIRELCLTALPGQRIMLCAISASDQPVAYARSIRSHGLPETWAQGAVYYALAEGLAGVVDTGRAFARAAISPRWSATEATTAAVCLHYPASNGYCAYTWQHDAAAQTLKLEVTGSFTQAELRCLLPPGARAAQATMGDATLPVTQQRVDRSTYAVLTLAALPTAPIVLRYAVGKKR